MTENLRVEPFTIAVADQEIAGLSERLHDTRWPETWDADDWSAGVPLAYLQELALYWADDYSWRDHEAQLNDLPQYVTMVDGQPIHFIHRRSPEPTAMPLVISHGWPGSIVEYMHVIDRLSDPRAHGDDPIIAFHVVCPSLPGYGFSGPTREPGWTPHRIAQAFDTLMTGLGYDHYGAHGGDWGARISRELGLIAPDRVAAVHLTLSPPVVPPDFDRARLCQDDLERLKAALHFRQTGTGYAAIQATRPRTLSYGLTDSPVGQLAWIVEKAKEWTDCDSVPEEAIDRDHLLTNVSVYWYTRTAGSAANLYYETNAGRIAGPAGVPRQGYSAVPTGIASFAKDVYRPVRQLAVLSDNVVHWSEFDRGGHFAAMEVPDLLLEDLRAFFLAVGR